MGTERVYQKEKVEGIEARCTQPPVEESGRGTEVRITGVFHLASS